MWGLGSNFCFNNRKFCFKDVPHVCFNKLVHLPDYCLIMFSKSVGCLVECLGSQRVACRGVQCVRETT